MTYTVASFYPFNIYNGSRAYHWTISETQARIEQAKLMVEHHTKRKIHGERKLLKKWKNTLSTLTQEYPEEFI